MSDARQPETPMPDTTVLLKTHFIDRQVLEKAYAIQNLLGNVANAKLVVCCDRSAGKIGDAAAEWLSARFDTFFFGGTERYQELGLPIHPLVLSGHHPANWFHGDYFLYDYVQGARQPSQYYWIVEYDVYPTRGTWTDLVTLGGDCDLVAPLLKVRSRPETGDPALSRFPVDAAWYWWDSYNGPEPRLGCFFPALRLSQALVDSLRESLTENRVGFCEVRVPSVTHEYGHAIVGMGDFFDGAGLDLVHPHWDRKRKNNLRFDILLTDDAGQADPV